MQSELNWRCYENLILDISGCIVLLWVMEGQRGEGVFEANEDKQNVGQVREQSR